MGEGNFIPHTGYIKFSPEEMQERAEAFFQEMQRRRSVRTFSDRPVPDGVIENCLRTAGSAPSGANLQPWHFVVVKEPEVKKKIRMAAEKEEREFYNNRAPAEWLKALEPLGTDADKEFLEKAPCLIAIFSKRYGINDSGEKIKHYYVKESVGIATGFLLAAIHRSGLAALTHTPSPMGFLNDILDRPVNERPFLLLVTGYPGKGVKVPDINKKPLKEIVTYK